MVPRSEHSQRRQQLGRILAPLAFILLLFTPINGTITVEAHHLRAVVVATVILWITEALPIPVASLLAPTLCILLGVTDARSAFANPIIFMFMGSFLLAEAIKKHGLDKRMVRTLLAIRFVNRSRSRILLAFGILGSSLSAWMSNTATTALLLPLRQRTTTGHVNPDDKSASSQASPRFALALMLMCAYACSAGGIATIVGTPPNGIGFTHLRTIDTDFSFLRWMLIGTPITIVLLFLIYATLIMLHRPEPQTRADSLWMTSKPGQQPWSAGEINVVLAFGTTVLLWIIPGLSTLFFGIDTPMTLWLKHRLPIAGPATLGAILLFILPMRSKQHQTTLSWREAARIDWGAPCSCSGAVYASVD